MSRTLERIATQERGRKVLVVEDDATLNRMLISQFTRMGFTTSGVASVAEATVAIGQIEPDLVLLDFRLPDAEGTEAISLFNESCPVIILTAYGSIDHAVQAVRAGASEYLVKPVSQARLEIAVERALETASMRKKLAFLETQMASSRGPNMVGDSKPFQRIRDMIRRVAQADTTVLIDGESGAGKELVAQSIHAESPRHSEQFVTIDCCTLQETLFESELFGHEKGAFTGADRMKQGLIEVAEGGTVFLDEIGEVSPVIQAKLLRVLETGHYRRLGGTRDLTSNVRFVAATNRDLRALSRDGKFREDLYYRLSAFTITVPPLRDRPEDIVPIANHFLQGRQFLRHVRKRFDPRVERQLAAYSWPGNIRELRNVVERSILMSGEDPVIRPEHLTLSDGSGKSVMRFSLGFDQVPTFDQLRDVYVGKVLDLCEGNKARAAKVMQISERTIYRHIKD